MYRGINDCKKGYHPRTNIVKDEKGDLVTDSHHILARWSNHCSQPLNFNGVNNVRQREIPTTESLVLEPSAFEVEMDIEKLKRDKSPGTDEIPAEIIKEGRRTIHSEIHKLINSIWNKEKLPAEWKESIIVPIYKKGNKTDCSNYRGMSLLSTTLKILSIVLLSKLTPYAEEFNGDRQCGFPQNKSTTDHIFCICQILEKKWQYNETVHQLLQTSRKPMIQLEGRSHIILSLSLVHKTNMANKNVSK